MVSCRIVLPQLDIGEGPLQHAIPFLSSLQGDPAGIVTRNLQVIEAGGYANRYRMNGISAPLFTGRKESRRSFPIGFSPD
jgi:hypothetical protein